MKVQIERFHLNGHTKGFRPQTQKVKATLQNSIIQSGSERVKQQSQCSIQYPHTEKFKVFESWKEDCVMFDVVSKTFL